MSYARHLLVAVTVSLSLTTAAFAQTPPAAATPPQATPALAAAPTRVRGIVSAVSALDFTVTTKAGDKVPLKIAENAAVTWIQPIAVSAIKPGAFIGTAAVAQPDGTLKALEIQVFPESMRGIGEGHRPWDLGPDSSMTNGTVGDLKVSKGRTLTLTYKGGEQTVFVPPKAPVITYAPATLAAVTKGSHVIVFVAQGPDQTLTATRIGVGRHGLVPPM